MSSERGRDAQLGNGGGQLAAAIAHKQLGPIVPLSFGRGAACVGIAAFRLEFKPASALGSVR